MQEYHRIVEAILFASTGPVRTKDIKSKLPSDVNVTNIIAELKKVYNDRGINLKENGDGWSFQTAPDLSSYLEEFKSVRKKLSKAAMETLSIIAYHQPITRPEIEQIRGVNVHSGTLDKLFDAGWIEPKGKKNVPGRPSLWRTTQYFLNYFDLKNINDLPSIRELKESGLLSKENSLSGYINLDTYTISG